MVEGLLLDRMMDAYESGKEEAVITDNLFWFGHKMTPDNTEHAYPRNSWEDAIKIIREKYKKMNMLERIAYNIGGILMETSLPMDPSKPVMSREYICTRP